MTHLLGFRLGLVQEGLRFPQLGFEFGTPVVFDIAPILQGFTTAAHAKRAVRLANWAQSVITQNMLTGQKRHNTKGTRWSGAGAGEHTPTDLLVFAVSVFGDDTGLVHLHLENVGTLLVRLRARLHGLARAAQAQRHQRNTHG